MELTILGSGTSTGVPAIGCYCATCRSTDPRDKRLRASAMISMAPGTPSILIDCGPDFRQQILGQHSPALACALLTHSHYDHVGGLDDLRPYCYISSDHRFDLYCRSDVARDLYARLPYCFSEVPRDGVPTFTVREITDEPFTVNVDGFGPVEVIPLPIMHGRLPIVGYRIGRLAYITDCSCMPPAATLERMRNLDVLVINALRAHPHPTHLNLQEALRVIDAVRPRKALLTHMSHETPPQAQAELMLPPGVEYAWDGLTVAVDNA